MKAIVKYYESLDDMPAMTRQAVRTMGFAYGGTLRSIANGLDHRCQCNGTLVIYENGHPVGWSVWYSFYDNWSHRTKHELGFWIRKRHRKKGYGIRLIKSAYKRWRVHNPEVFDSVKPIWKAFDIVNALKHK